jgi:gamma-glutamyltranspeptidase / glutathione hydrolase
MGRKPGVVPLRVAPKLLLSLAVLALALPAGAFEPVAARHGIVVSSEAHATDIGLEILRQGGNAVDAAVAVGFALQVTYPQAGNIGGGGFMMIHLASGKSVMVDYREEAPGAASRDMYLDAQGNLIPKASTVGARAVGVPGTVAGLALAEQKYGKLGLRRVLEPAIQLAEKGFVVSYAYSRQLKHSEKYLSEFPETRRDYLQAGKPYEPGQVFRQPELARTLRLIARKGPQAFYSGPIAAQIVATMKKYGGLITRRDLRHYQAKLREPLVGHFRGFTILAPPPPSSGGIVLIEMLNILDPLDLGAPDSYKSIHLMAEAMRRAYADRAAYLGDTDFVRVPIARLTSREYAAKLRQEILNERPEAAVEPGLGAFPPESTQTTHFSVVDAAGNAVSNTYTLNAWFGSAVTVGGAGFLLNDEMDDFASKPGAPNALFGLVQGEANAIAPYKRPLSSMTPVIVLEADRGSGFGVGGSGTGTKGSRIGSRESASSHESPGPKPETRIPNPEPQVRLVLGSPGGGTIINTVLQVSLNVLAYKMDVLRAVLAPRFHDQWRPDRLFLERWGFSADTVEKLRQAGYDVEFLPSIGECEAIAVDPRTGWRFGAADPRGDGKAAGY